MCHRKYEKKLYRKIHNALPQLSFDKSHSFKKQIKFYENVTSSIRSSKHETMLQRSSNQANYTICNPIKNQTKYKIHFPVIYETYKMAEAMTDITTITVISFLDNMLEEKLTRFVYRNRYLHFLHVKQRNI